VAISGDGASLSYGELARRVERLAGRLAALQAGGDSPPVAVYLDRGADLVVALLAVLAAGGSYLPLDPHYPHQRLAYMVEDAGATFGLTSARRAAELAALGVPAPRLVLVDGEPGPPAGRQPGSGRRPALPGRKELLPEHLAYVLYTSGSTGRPKGVQVSHGALANLLLSMSRVPGLGPADRLLAVTPVSFDIAGLELFLPLTVGAELVLVGRDVAGDGERLHAALAAAAATVMQATPATWRLLLAAGWQRDSLPVPLCAWCGGEALPGALAGELLARAKEVWNLYGPTETTIW
jgi:non-ribosomal peptide synthetase component F